MSDAHDTSEHHHLGDEELAQIRLNHSNVHHKVPTLTTTAGSSTIGQSPSPHRATRYQSVPPDEDELPKRVAVVATNGTKATTTLETPPSPPTTPLDNQLDQNVTVLSSNHARTTVTPDNIQSSPNDGIGHQPTTPSTALEEAKDWPVHPALRDTHTAPPPVKIILDKMNNVLLKNHMIIIDTIEHTNQNTKIMGQCPSILDTNSGQSINTTSYYCHNISTPPMHTPPLQQNNQQHIPARIHSGI